MIGYGYWGPNLVRNFMSDTDWRVVAVCDRAESRLAGVSRLYPGVTTTTKPEDLFRNPEIDAIAIATPVATHFELAMGALGAGKHALVEKPIASTSEQASQMIEEAARRKLVLLVDHTFVFTGAVRKIRDVTSQDSFGTLQYYDSTRVNLGLFQHDVNVMWDLAVHDLSIMDFVHRCRADRGVSNRVEPCSRAARERGLHDALLRSADHCAHQCQLALAGEDQADARRRQQADDRVRRSRDQREGQDLRQGDNGNRDAG